MKSKSRQRRGLSLIEILIVVVIVGILSALIYPALAGQLQKARDTKRKLDINLIHKALEQYYDSTNCYPANLEICRGKLRLGSTDLIPEIPCDPKTKIPYTYVTNQTGCNPWFQLYAKLERSDDALINLIGCRAGCGPSCQYNYGVSSPNKALNKCTPTPTPTSLLTPTPTPVQYVCAPGGGADGKGKCEPFEIPTLGLCPTVYPDDPNCQGACSAPQNRCKTSRGKQKPEGWQ